MRKLLKAWIGNDKGRKFILYMIQETSSEFDLFMEKLDALGIKEDFEFIRKAMKDMDIYEIGFLHPEDKAIIDKACNVWQELFE